MREEGRTNKSSILLSHSFLFPFVTPDLTLLHFAEHLNTSVLKCRGTKTSTWHRWKTNPTPSVCISSWDQLCRQPWYCCHGKRQLRGCRFSRWLGNSTSASRSGCQSAALCCCALHPTIGCSCTLASHKHWGAHCPSGRWGSTPALSELLLCWWAFLEERGSDWGK